MRALFIIKEGMEKERCLQWLQRFRPDICELRVETYVADEMLKLQGQPAFGEDWHPWLERAANDVIRRL